MTRPRYERRDGVEIEGASPQQREALELVLAGIPGTRIEALLVRDFELDEGATGPIGTRATRLLRYGLSAFKQLSGHFDFGRDGS